MIVSDLSLSLEVEGHDAARNEPNVLLLTEIPVVCVDSIEMGHAGHERLGLKPPDSCVAAILEARDRVLGPKLIGAVDLHLCGTFSFHINDADARVLVDRDRSGWTLIGLAECARRRSDSGVGGVT